MPRDNPVLDPADEVIWTWADPDRSVLRLNRRPPPRLPIEVFGPNWAKWIEDAAQAACSPVDYVVACLLPAASVAIGNARWAQAWPGWEQPPFLWTASVGESGSGKSPGAKPVLRIIPEIEKRMRADFPDQLRLWKVAEEKAIAEKELWKKDLKEAIAKNGKKPDPPLDPGPRPQAPQFKINDITIESVAISLATSAPKGLMIYRDELAGFLNGMTQYNLAGRQFWLEFYDGDPFTVHRQKYPEPIVVPHNGGAIFGTIQPDRLVSLMKEPDDGLLSRFLWFWPEPIPFDISHAVPNTEWAIEAFDRLRMLELQPGDPPSPLLVPLAADAVSDTKEFAQEMQQEQQVAEGLMKSTLGKARGTALRLSLIIEMLWWAGDKKKMGPPPTKISRKALNGAAQFVSEYALPMAERVFGDAATSQRERNIVRLARWIARERPDEVYVNHLQRSVRLPGLTEAEAIHAAAAELVECGWLRPPPRGNRPGRVKQAYTINQRVWEAIDG